MASTSAPFAQAAPIWDVAYHPPDDDKLYVNHNPHMPMVMDDLDHGDAVDVGVDVDTDADVKPFVRLLRHDSEFSVGTDYDDGSPNNVSAFQAAVLLTADCIGVGLLALPKDMHTLGLTFGLSFLVLNMPINLYAGTIFHYAAVGVEDRQYFENDIYQTTTGNTTTPMVVDPTGTGTTTTAGGSILGHIAVHDTDTAHEKEGLIRRHRQTASLSDYQATNQFSINSVQSIGTANGVYNIVQVINQGTINSVQSGYYASPTLRGGVNQNTINSTQSALSGFYSIQTTGTAHTQLHHDTATLDFIGMTQALFDDTNATRTVLLFFYSNLFLVLGNYILVMSHAVVAMFGGSPHIHVMCIPTAGVIASTLMFLMCQFRTMAGLGRRATYVSLMAILIVITQCLVAVHHHQQQQQQQDSDGLQQSTAIPYTTTLSSSNLFLLTSTSLMRQLASLGNIGFAVGSQKLFLNIRHEMRNRNESPCSLCMSLTTFVSFYVVVVLAAGPNPPSFLFDTIPPGWNRRLAGLLLWTHVSVSYALNSQALCSSIDRLIWHRIPLPFGWDETPQGRWMSLTAVVSMAAFSVSMAIPFFADLLSLIGALTSVPLTFILPAMFWRKCSHAPLWTMQVPDADESTLTTTQDRTSLGLIYFAVTFMIVATIGAISSIQQDWAQQTSVFACYFPKNTG